MEISKNLNNRDRQQVCIKERQANYRRCLQKTLEPNLFALCTEVFSEKILKTEVIWKRWKQEIPSHRDSLTKVVETEAM